jgi:hypothetical protein
MINIFGDIRQLSPKNCPLSCMQTNIMITIFADFRQFLAKNIFFLKTNVMISILHKLSVYCSRYIFLESCLWLYVCTTAGGQCQTDPTNFLVDMTKDRCYDFYNIFAEKFS